MRINHLPLFAILFLSTPVLAGKKLHVLFIGNSYTNYNNMPQIVADMAATTGDTLVFDMYAPGGYTLGNHAADTAAVNRIKKGGWDFMVLQEQSQLPAVLGFTTGLADLRLWFNMYNPCGRVMLYMTWGRKNGDASNCVNFPEVCTYEGMDSCLRNAYITAATGYKTDLSPVGAAWHLVRKTNPGINLYQPDESHPTAEGSYLIASCFYAALFKKNPTAVSYNFSLGVSVAGTLRQAAKAVVYDSLSFWDHVVTMPTASFNYYISTGVNQVQFLNAALNADSYHWDFGDGSTSAVQHPAHSYAANGTYTVTMTAFNCDVDTTYQVTCQKTVTFCAHTPTVTPLAGPLCPGTTGTLWTQPYDAYQWYDEYYNPIPGATGQSLTVSSEGRFYVAATLNGCTELSAPVTVLTAGLYSPWFIMPMNNMMITDTACIGDTMILMVAFNKPPVANDTLIDWAFNGQPLAGYHNDTLLVTQPGTYAATVRHELCPNLYKTQQVNITFIKCPSNVANVTAASFMVAPNPVTGMLTISSPAFGSAAYTISITNSFGQTVYRQPSAPSAQQSIDLSAYSNGIYFISIAGEGSVVYRGKVVKQ